MASALKIAANRRNAQKSTGPRSSAGKARTRRNAFRHGLAIPVTCDVLNGEVIKAVADQLLRKGASSAEQEHAQLAAEVQVEIARLRQAKVDILNRAGRLNIADGDLPDEIMAVAFVAELGALSAFARYEGRALSKRRRMLRALAAAERANDVRVNVFLEPVERLNVTGVVKAALARLPEVRSSEPDSSETHGVKFDLGSDGSLEAFIQCHDGISGSMRVHTRNAGNATSTQNFTIAKRSAGVAGERWVAICPTTGRLVANLYVLDVLASGRAVKSRHALNLHYRSKHRHRGKQEDTSSLGTAEYAAFVAAISEPAEPLTEPSTMPPCAPEQGPEITQPKPPR
jgi:hypothetical protein